MNLMKTEEAKEIRTVGAVWALYEAAGLTKPHVNQANFFEDAKILKKLLDRVEELEGLLKEIYPQIYGMLCETWGHPKDWPKYGAAGAITYEKIKVALGIDSDKEVQGGT